MSGVFTYIADLMSRGDTLDHALRLANQSNVFNAPTDVNTITGTPTGSVSDLITLNDNNTYDVVEVSGGMDVQVDFDVTRIDGLAIKCEYDGSSSHVVLVQLYNYAIADWDTFISIEDQLASNYRYIEIPDDTNYIDSGDAIVRLFHDTPATPNHDLYIDYVSLVETQPVGNSGNLSSIEGTAILSTGETGGSKYLREDGDGTSSWQTTSGDLLAANNLSDVDSASTSRTNLGLGTMAVEAAADYVEIAGDTMTGALVIETDLTAENQVAFGANGVLGGTSGTTVLDVADTVSAVAGLTAGMDFDITIDSNAISAIPVGINAKGTYGGNTALGLDYVYGIKAQGVYSATVNPASNTILSIGVLGSGRYDSAEDMDGVAGVVGIVTTETGSGTITDSYNFLADSPTGHIIGGVDVFPTNVYAYAISDDFNTDVPGNNTNTYGLYVPIVNNRASATYEVIGVKVDDQAIAGAGDAHGIHLNGDAATADICFGADKDYQVYGDNTDLIVDTTLTASGSLKLKNASGLKFSDAGDSHAIKFVPPALTEDTTYTLPDADGNAGDHLETNGSGALSWVTTLQAIQLTTDWATNINGTNIVVDWDTAAEINHGTAFSHDEGGANPSRITINTTGTYVVTASLAFTSAVIRANIILTIRKNGSTVLSGQGKSGYIRYANGHDEASCHLTAIVDLTATDYIEVISNQEGAAGTVTLTAGESLFNVHKLG